MARQSGSARIARNGFRDITATLRGRIEAGEFIAGAYLPTERELQEGFGASRATVRKALAALIDSGWAFNVPKKGVVATRGLKPGLSSDVAFIHIDTFSLGALSERLAFLLKESGLSLVHMAGPAAHPMESAFRLAAESNFVGAIVWSYRGFPDGDQIKTVAGHLPIVALDHRIGGADTDLVTFDHEAAAFEATDHLAKSGCKRIGVTGMLDMLEITHHRIRGYMRAMFTNGLQPQPQDFVFSYTSGLHEADTSLFEARLNSGDRPDGFLVLQDFLVTTTAKAATRAGLSLPNDLKLATIGIELGPDVIELTAAAIELDWESLAQQAVELLGERLDNLHRPPQMRFAPHYLVVDKSVGTEALRPASETNLSKAVSSVQAMPRPQNQLNATWHASNSGQQSRSGEILS